MQKVSVLMGAYNVSRVSSFDQVMQSVMKQSYCNFEFIICDDGSTDNTYNLLKKYAGTDDRVHLIRNDGNCGLAASLNHCLDIATGDMIARQDADDLSSLDRFEKQVTFLSEHSDIGFVGSNVLLYDEHGIWGKRIFPIYPQKEDFLFTTPFVHGSIMFRKEVLSAVGGYRVAKETRRTEDYDLQMRLYAAGYRGANLQEFLYSFCEDAQSIGRRKYSYRIDEAKIRWKGFNALGLMPGAMPYVIKPLIVGLLPTKLLMRLKKGRTLQLIAESKLDNECTK